MIIRPVLLNMSWMLLREFLNIYLDLRMDWLVCMCPNQFSVPQLRSSRDFDNMWRFVRCWISDLNLGYPYWNCANSHVQDVAGHFRTYRFAATSIFVALRSTTRSLFLPILSFRWLSLYHVIKLSNHHYKLEEAKNREAVNLVYLLIITLKSREIAFHFEEFLCV